MKVKILRNVGTSLAAQLKRKVPAFKEHEIANVDQQLADALLAMGLASPLDGGPTAVATPAAVGPEIKKPEAKKEKE